MSTLHPPSDPPSDSPPTPTTRPRPPRLPVATMVVVGVMLLIPCAALAAVPTYSRETPKVLGWPFFYWYQVLWVFLTPLLTVAAYLVIKRARGDR
jgi:hypothetical protein